MCAGSERTTAALLQGDDLAVLRAPSSSVWMLFGVLAGVVFGTAGTWARGAGWRQVVGIALPAAVFFEEAARFAGKATDPDYPAGAWWNVAIDLALGLLIVVLTGGSHRRRALTVAVAGNNWPTSTASTVQIWCKVHSAGRMGGPAGT